MLRTFQMTLVLYIYIKLQVMLFIYLFVYLFISQLVFLKDTIVNNGV